MAVFEVGNRYNANDRDLGSVLVVKRTDKSVWVKNDHYTWRMKIRRDESGNEYAYESCHSPRRRDNFTFSAKWRVME